MIFYLAIALIAGLTIANQTPVNTDLRGVVKSPFLAASISFLVGTVFLALVSLATAGKVFPSLQFISTTPGWVWIGGVLGAIFLTTNVFLFPRLGALQTVILPILGQILMGVAIDNFGWFGAGEIKLTMVRVLGIVVIIVGVVIAVVLANLTKNASVSTDKKKNLLGWRIWAIICGGLSAMQSAINGHLGTLLGNSAQASFVSFFVGFILIFIVAMVVDRRLPSLTQLKSARPWHYLGGILGAVFIFASVVAVPQIGAGLTIMMALIGQILGSMLVQQFGWWRSPCRNIGLWQVVGVLVMAVGIVIVKFL